MSVQVLLDSSQNSGKCLEIRNDIPKSVVRIKKQRKKKESVNVVESIPDIIPNHIDSIEKEVLSHLGNYDEEPFEIIESYFKGQYLERLVKIGRAHV